MIGYAPFPPDCRTPTPDPARRQYFMRLALACMIEAMPDAAMPECCEELSRLYLEQQREKEQASEGRRKEDASRPLLPSDSPAK